LTFGSIAVAHSIVDRATDDRDLKLTLWGLYVFESNLIVLDCFAFFCVGRLWRQRGVDHLAWILPMVVCNVYFASQQYVWWLQNSISLYAMHCVWPWQLWVFIVVIIIPTICLILLLHVKRAIDKNLLLIKLFEMILVLFFFLAAPMTHGSYFHFHHWFAGFFLGMHCNFNIWWSRVVMAYCWGMYINGIATYGRDPILTCEYAYFLSIDLDCPYTPSDNITTTVEEIMSVDWRNCSATTGYHP